MVQDFRLWSSGHRISLIMGELDVTGDRTVFIFTRDCSYIYISTRYNIYYKKCNKKIEISTEI
jgi:hypothetical protein